MDGFNRAVKLWLPITFDMVPHRASVLRMRRQIRSSVPANDEQQDILEKLAVLEAAQGSPSFPHRYSEFISTAANHMTLLAPFIPALTEILSKALR
jgi:hypothetical protein